MAAYMVYRIQMMIIGWSRNLDFKTSTLDLDSGSGLE